MPPLYDQECPDCDHRFTDFRRMEDYDAVVPCPECGFCETDRLMSARVSVVMKGSTPDANEMTRKAHGLQRGDQIFENPRSGETVHLTGSKKERQGQIARSLESAGYQVTSTRDVEVPNP
jgi:putative FmdB family regulatory protein